MFLDPLALSGSTLQLLEFDRPQKINLQSDQIKILTPLFNSILIDKKVLNNPHVQSPFVIDIDRLKSELGTPQLEHSLEEMLCQFLQMFVVLFILFHGRNGQVSTWRQALVQ